MDREQMLTKIAEVGLILLIPMVPDSLPLSGPAAADDKVNDLVTLSQKIAARHVLVNHLE